MPITALLYTHKLPHLSPTTFKTHIEETHVPLVQRLLGPDHPSTHTRYYTSKSEANSYAVGRPEPSDPDMIAVITYESREAMGRSMAVRMSVGVREVIEEDEARFMVREMVRVVVLGEGGVGRTVKEEEKGEEGT